MRNVWMVPVFAVLLMGFGRCEWWPPPGGGGDGDGDSCRRDRECAGAGMCVDGSCECSGVLVLCAAGTLFNDDPSVCECEPVETFCGGIAGFRRGADVLALRARLRSRNAVCCGGLCEATRRDLCPVGSGSTKTRRRDCIRTKASVRAPPARRLVCATRVRLDEGWRSTGFLKIERAQCAGFLVCGPGEAECVDDATTTAIKMRRGCAGSASATWAPGSMPRLNVRRLAVRVPCIPASPAAGVAT